MTFKIQCSVHFCLCATIHSLQIHQKISLVTGPKFINFFIFIYPHMLIGKVYICRLLFVCFCNSECVCVCVCVCLCVCTVEDFSAEDKASGVKFCTVVHRRPSFPRSPKSDESASAPLLQCDASRLL